ncbi:hypothetical protein BH11PSE12_BH11PSE12_03990 [soil metagenome]
MKNLYITFMARIAPLMTFEFAVILALFGIFFCNVWIHA